MLLSIIAAILFSAIRAPLLVDDGVTRGWNSDAAILGLMGRDILRGGFPIFYWGQNYMGPFTSIVTAATALALQPLVTREILWPLSLRVATLLIFFAAVALLAFTFSRRAGTAGLIAGGLSLIGPPFFFKATVITHGTEMVLFFSALLIAVALPMMEPLAYRPARLLATGFIAGVGWWMNQGVVFAIAALIVAAWWKASGSTTQLRSPAPRGLLRALCAVALLWLGWNAIAMTFPGTLLTVRFRAPLAEPLMLLALLYVTPLLWSQYRRAQSATRERLLRGGSFLFIGFIAGWSPVWIGRFAGWYERTYSFSTALNDPAGLLSISRLLALEYLPRFAGVEHAPILVIPVAAVAVTGAVGPIPWPRASTLRLVCVLLISANFAHFILTQGSRPSLHYLVPSVPFFCFLLVTGGSILWMRRNLIARAVVAVGALAIVTSWTLGVADLIRRIRSEADPRSVIAAVERGGYSVCHADYWQAYHLQLFDSGTPFIPWRSHDRNPEQTRAASRLEGPRCFVTAHYDVLPFNALVEREAPSASRATRGFSSTSAGWSAADAP